MIVSREVTVARSVVVIDTCSAGRVDVTVAVTRGRVVVIVEAGRVDATLVVIVAVTRGSVVVIVSVSVVVKGLATRRVEIAVSRTTS